MTVGSKRLSGILGPDAKLSHRQREFSLSILTFTTTIPSTLLLQPHYSVHRTDNRQERLSSTCAASVDSVSSSYRLRIL